MTRNTGRPRNFDEGWVVDKALVLFWELGYEAVSLNKLISHVGMNKPSFYNTFGSKENIFNLAFSQYKKLYLNFRDEAIVEKSPRNIIRRLLAGAVELYAGEGTPRGCLMAATAASCSPEAASIRLTIIRERYVFCQILIDRFKNAPSSACLPAGMSDESAALLVQTMIEGLAVQARFGARRRDLEITCEAFLALWPENC